MIRKLKFSGLWYPKDKDELLELVKFTPRNDNNSIYGVVPHAGLFYSASLIKLFFELLSSNINKIILLTPSHYYRLEENTIGSGDFEYFETPFKNIEGFSLSIFEGGYEKATQREHAVEMILPFIAQIDNIKLCCAHVNEFNDLNIIKKYAKEIITTIDNNTAIIASSDFTHYGTNFNHTPFGNKINKEVINEVTKYDRNIANYLINGDINSASKIAYKDKSTICGLAPMLLISEIARLANIKGEILDQSNSIKKPLYDNNFVSYLALAWRR